MKKKEIIPEILTIYLQLYEVKITMVSRENLEGRSIQ
jgi:hypothetical protein